MALDFRHELNRFNKASAAIYFTDVPRPPIADEANPTPEEITALETWSGTFSYVGCSDNAKTFSPTMETFNFQCNEDGVAKTIVTDISSVSYIMNFSFTQWDRQALAMVLNADFVDVDEGAKYRIELKSQPQKEYAMRAVLTLRDGSKVAIELYRVNVAANGDISFGEVGAYSMIPATVTALALENGSYGNIIGDNPAPEA